MTKIEDKKPNINIQFKAIELLNSLLNPPSDYHGAIVDFTFKLGIESTVDVANKVVSVMVRVEIQDNEKAKVGALSIRCIFEIVPFEEIICLDEKGDSNIPSSVLEELISTSISTLRGIMFSTFSGTFLHGAILPIIYPIQFLPTSQKILK